MSKLILCEGKTDAILLSYYLERMCGWTHGNEPKSLSIHTEEIKGESAFWYKKGNENLLICGVGGKDKFQMFFQKKICAAMIDSSAFSKIAIVTDRDNRLETAICDSFHASLKPVITEIEHNTWITNTYQNSFGQQAHVDFLLVIIPKNKEGALETLLLDAISENGYDRNIVEQCRLYIDEIAPMATKYIGKNRLKLKALLGVTWAIQYPEKIFSFIDEQIRAVKWEDSVVLGECFRELVAI